MHHTPKLPVPLLDEQLCFALYSVSLAMNRVYRKRLRALGLTYSQYLVMMVLWEQDSLTVSSIGDRLFLDSATLTPLLKRMERQDLVSRARATDDERQVIIRLSDTGSAMRRKAAVLGADVRLATGCSTTQLAALNKQLLTLRTALLDFPEPAV